MQSLASVPLLRYFGFGRLNDFGLQDEQWSLSDALRLRRPTSFYYKPKIPIRSDRAKGQ